MLLLSTALAGVSVSPEQGLRIEDERSKMVVAGHFLFDQQVVFSPSTGKAQLVLQRIRPDLRVDLGVVPVRARLQTEFVGDPKVLDAYVDFGPKNLYLRVGRFLLPSGRAQMTAVPKLAFQGFSNSSNANRGGRMLGGMGVWTPGPGVLQAGMFGDGFDDEVGWRAVGRGSVDLINHVPYDETSALSGDAKPAVAIGASAQWHTVGQVATAAAEITAQAGRLRLQTEGFVATDKRRGGYAQLAVTVLPGHLDFGARIDHNQDEDGTSNTLEGLVSAYVLGNHARVQLGYQHALAPSAVGNLRVASQVWF